MSSVLLEELHDKYGDLEVRTLDLFSADLPAVAGSNIKSKYALMTGQPLDEDARRSWREIERTIEGFLDADVYLLTVPMWNFGIPYALKYTSTPSSSPATCSGTTSSGSPSRWSTAGG